MVGCFGHILAPTNLYQDNVIKVLTASHKFHRVCGNKVYCWLVPMAGATQVRVPIKM